MDLISRSIQHRADKRNSASDKAIYIKCHGKYRKQPAKHKIFCHMGCFPHKFSYMLYLFGFFVTVKLRKTSVSSFKNGFRHSTAQLSRFFTALCGHKKYGYHHYNRSNSSEYPYSYFRFQKQYLRKIIHIHYITKSSVCERKKLYF